MPNLEQAAGDAVGGRQLLEGSPGPGRCGLVRAARTRPAFDAACPAGGRLWAMLGGSPSSCLDWPGIVR